jgi:hypothetical protein
MKLVKGGHDFIHCIYESAARNSFFFFFFLL